MLTFVLVWLHLVLGLLRHPLAVDRVPIASGAFVRGSAAHAAEADERPARTVAVAAFTIDRTEVTRGAYTSCVLQGRCARRGDVRIADLLSFLPMTDVSFAEAAAYCAAVDARLPSETEWERAARGPHDARIFPWGDEADCTRANWGNYEGEGRCPKNAGRPVEVGSFPGGASPDGVLDLAGNVWEWTADFYDPDAYRKRFVKAIPRGAEELGRAPRRSVRGGACCSILAAPRLANRVGFPEDYRDVDLGFRCAR